MTVFVFTGPTLPVRVAQCELEAMYLPPVSQGDVYRAALERPRAIGIIDGYFERVPAVWHKEILWAISQRIPVYGSASMGALRAAELAPFGMRGVGTIFEAYRDGVLEDDDEVALAHGLADSEYRAHSEPMVNIRYTMAKAARAGVVSSDTRTWLVRLAKALFYPERSYPEILRLAATHGLPANELERLRGWLPEGHVDQKRDDALAMLRLMRDELAAGPDLAPAPFTFEHTVHWDDVIRETARQKRAVRRQRLKQQE